MLMLSCESTTLRVLVVDDHELTRLTLQLAFAAQENLHVVGLACNGQEAIEIVKSCQPDVVVLDLQMPVMDGWSASSQIKAISPHTQILAYSSVEDANFLGSQTIPNFDCFCQKDVPTTQLIALVRQLGERAVNG
ncbi:MAG TPA: response regulator transcription factor [Nodularia sp. (in: cyanobacteria)]|nr:response regulator transcription factor [Nodularia sp. (in: cyanobacteria)]